MKGRKAKPVEQHRREGTLRPDRHPAPVLIGGRAAPRMPSYLPARAKTAWRQIVPRLAEVGMLDRVDGPALEALCLNVGIMREAAAELKDAPMLVSGSGGNVKRNPIFDVFGSAQREARVWCERFGLDPASRTRLGLSELQRRGVAQELDARLGETRLRRVK